MASIYGWDTIEVVTPIFENNAICGEGEEAHLYGLSSRSYNA
jgi:hypothetical protein